MNRAGGIALLAAPVLLGVASCGVLGIVVLGDDDPAASVGCAVAGAAAVVDPASVSGVSSEGLSADPEIRAEQLSNAAAIMQAAADSGLDQQAQVIGVMTAWGESTLQVLDRGDAVGPDSRGLFQQRDNGAWGSYEDRMDPYRSAMNFFRALAGVSGWQGMEPSLAAHAVQRNADPWHYERFYPLAVQLVGALASGSQGGATPAGDTAPAAGAAATSTTVGCGSTSAASVSIDGWTDPLPDASGPSSGYGMRFHPVFHEMRLHAGTDIPAPCGTPYYAAAPGVVVSAAGAGASSTSYVIEIDHGGGLMTRYLHSYPDGIFAHVGDEVAAGDLIGEVGSAGPSTGCHLHYEVRQDGEPQDPVTYMDERGIEL
ncbi:M23 family metallopeptidase [Isoptericola sp. F-RaC21]|uniref:M23 family metallopeptidase n=1 Tax=Isoptericola sp. F-RaC21 TaxID=3141452 RepID=UPI00315C222A